jgi:hypothetical protein
MAVGLLAAVPRTQAEVTTLDYAARASGPGGRHA